MTFTIPGCQVYRSRGSNYPRTYSATQGMCCNSVYRRSHCSELEVGTGIRRMELAGDIDIREAMKEYIKDAPHSDPRVGTPQEDMLTLSESNVLALFATLACLVRLFLRRATQRKELPLPPGPKGLPIIGNVLQMPRTHIERGFAKLSEKYGALQVVPLAWMLIHLRVNRKVSLSTWKYSVIAW